MVSTVAVAKAGEDGAGLCVPSRMAETTEQVLPATAEEAEFGAAVAVWSVFMGEWRMESVMEPRGVFRVDRAGLIAIGEGSEDEDAGPQRPGEERSCMRADDDETWAEASDGCCCHSSLMMEVEEEGGGNWKMCPEATVVTAVGVGAKG